jgi:hypothetical protein
MFTAEQIVQQLLLSGVCIRNTKTFMSIFIFDNLNYNNALYFLSMHGSVHPNNILIHKSQQPTRKENNWETKETMERATLTLETERAKWPNPGCL